MKAASQYLSLMSRYKVISASLALLTYYCFTRADTGWFQSADWRPRVAAKFPAPHFWRLITLPVNDRYNILSGCHILAEMMPKELISTISLIGEMIATLITGLALPQTWAVVLITSASDFSLCTISSYRSGASFRAFADNRGIYFRESRYSWLHLILLSDYSRSFTAALSLGDHWLSRPRLTAYAAYFKAFTPFTLSVMPATSTSRLKMPCILPHTKNLFAY